jgi:hypothetical protein
VTAVAVDAAGTVYVGTDKGVVRHQNGAWLRMDGAPVALVQAMAAAPDGILAVIGDGLYTVKPGKVERMCGVGAARVSALAAEGSSVYLATADGLLKANGRSVSPVAALNRMLGDSKAVHAVATWEGGPTAVGADAGLFVSEDGHDWVKVKPADARGRAWAPRNVQGVAYDTKRRLWFASSSGVGCKDQGAWTLYTGADGLPYNEFTTMAAGEGGVVWFGTSKGAIRFDGKHWAYRQGRRWLPNDEVRAIVVNANGDAWFATSAGAGSIERRMMTLAEKARFYEDEIDKYNRRTEFGYVLEARVQNPGDKSEWTNQDSDNDGLWTSMYGAGECFAYAATKDPKAKARAKQAFEALRFLSVAPVDGEVKQQPGYVARTVLPVTEPNPNERESYTVEGQQRRTKGDLLWKVYYPRWPLTKDKKYYYKTDTSSDELDGHYFFYGVYYDLVADTEDEKERVRKVVRDITDHLIRNDFCLVDHDGKPTRWAVYSPAKLNHDPMWQMERGLNSLSILSYLAVAEHVTGDPKYRRSSDYLRREHAFDTNAMVAKIQSGFGSGNHSDDEMAIMGYYNLIKYTKDDQLRDRIRFSFCNYMGNEWPEMNPFFNFAYAACGLGKTYTTPFGTWDLSPWEGWLEDSLETLVRFPLDRLNWSHTNSHRTDIIRLPRQQLAFPFEPWEEVRTYKRGYRVNGKVLPVDERHFNHWNTDPWDLDYGGNGTGLADGAVFLLPYYMGLHHGFIKETP